MRPIRKLCGILLAAALCGCASGRAAQLGFAVGGGDYAAPLESPPPMAAPANYGSDPTTATAGHGPSAEPPSAGGRGFSLGVGGGAPTRQAAAAPRRRDASTLRQEVGQDEDWWTLDLVYDPVPPLTLPNSYVFEVELETIGRGTARARITGPD